MHTDESMKPHNQLPPVLLLGGDANALSVARSLAHEGIPVHAIGLPDSPMRWSRCCRWIPIEIQSDVQASWVRFLLGGDSDNFRGAVLLSCCDDSIELIAKHRDELSHRFKLDDSNRDAQLCMLNKLATYRAAVAAGVPTPRFWVADSREQLDGIRDELCYPLIVKPQHSHAFAARIGKEKFLRVENFSELIDAHRRLTEQAGIAVVLMESIPGPDDRLCSYYTYLDEHGRPLFDFTKRIIRRSPMNRGPACYHVTDWNPDVKEVALRLFQHVGLRGLANAEFKRDERDGKLKLIECNARFTAANCLVTASGLDLSKFVYNRLVGRPFELPSEYTRGLHLWDPVLDFRAFAELRRTRQLTLGDWVSSLRQPKTLPYFRWTDPLPSIMCGLARLAKAIGSGIQRIRRAIAASFRGAALEGMSPAPALVKQP
jgi:predicted ATP-grasp superfamily ATP-dependent carboligase